MKKKYPSYPPQNINKWWYIALIAGILAALYISFGGPIVW